jgi:hypothetical protein
MVCICDGTQAHHQLHRHVHPALWLFWASRVGIVLSGFGVLPAIWRQVKEDEAGLVHLADRAGLPWAIRRGLYYVGKANIDSSWLLFGGLSAWAVGMNIIGIRVRRCQSGWAFPVL